MSNNLEKYIWSLDVSTTNIGFSLWNSEGKLIELKHLELKIDKNIIPEDRYIHKSEIFREYVEDYKNHILNNLNGEISNIIIEAPLLNSNNSNTVISLYSFNGIVCYILYKTFNIIPKKISIHEIRKLFLPELVKITKVKGEKKETLSFPVEYKEKKKLYIWERVAKLEPHIVWFYKKNSKELSDLNYDLSDSYACGYAYFKQIGIIK